MKTLLTTVAMTIALAVLAPPVFADSGEIDCHRPENVKYKNAEKKRYQDMLAHNKAGRAKQAYDIASRLDSRCISNNDKEIQRIEADQAAVLKKSSLQLGQQAENKGRYTEAYKYYEYYHGSDADRVQWKLAKSKPGNLGSVQTGVYYLRNKRKYLSEAAARNTKTGDIDSARLAAMNHFTSKDDVDAMDPNRNARIKAIDGYLGELKAIATKQGEKYLADEDKIFRARKTSLAAKGDTFTELNRARDWFSLFGQEKHVKDRAVKRGDTLLADDSRKSLELAITYFGYADHPEKLVQKAKDKAHRLGDAHLKKGEKEIAVEYYHIAGLDDKASKLEEAHEAETAKAEAKRQGQFKQEQKSLEKELGL